MNDNIAYIAGHITQDTSVWEPVPGVTYNR